MNGRFPDRSIYIYYKIEHSFLFCAAASQHRPGSWCFKQLCESRVMCTIATQGHSASSIFDWCQAFFLGLCGIFRGRCGANIVSPLTESHTLCNDTVCGGSSSLSCPRPMKIVLGRSIRTASKEAGWLESLRAHAGRLKVGCSTTGGVPPTTSSLDNIIRVVCIRRWQGFTAYP